MSSQRLDVGTNQIAVIYELYRLVKILLPYFFEPLMPNYSLITTSAIPKQARGWN